MFQVLKDLIIQQQVSSQVTVWSCLILLGHVAMYETQPSMSVSLVTELLSKHSLHKQILLSHGVLASLFWWDNQGMVCTGVRFIPPWPTRKTDYRCHTNRLGAHLDEHIALDTWTHQKSQIAHKPSRAPCSTQSLQIISTIYPDHACSNYIRQYDNSLLYQQTRGSKGPPLFLYIQSISGTGAFITRSPCQPCTFQGILLQRPLMGTTQLGDTERIL